MTTNPLVLVTGATDKTGRRIREIAAATGRRISYVSVSPDDYRTGAIEHGVSVEIADALAEPFVRVLDGRNAYVGHGVEQALGRPATDFSEYVRRTAATGAWNTDDLDVAG